MSFDHPLPPIQVHLCVQGGDAEIAFYDEAFGAQCTFRQRAGEGRLGHVWAFDAALGPATGSEG